MGLGPSFHLIRALFVACIFLAGPSLFAAVFKSYAPNNWKLVSQKGDNAIYKNSLSEDNETIVLQVFPAQANDAKLITHLDLQRLTREREKFLNGFGIGNYTALAVKTGRPRDRKFINYTEIESLYRDLRNRDVQMIERQFVSNGTMYVISYLIDGPAINDRKRANRALDSFQPIQKPEKSAELETSLDRFSVASIFSFKSLFAVGVQYLSPEAQASDVAESLSSSSDTFSNSPSTAKPASPIIEEKLNEADIAQRCQDVPPEKRRTGADSSFLGYVKSSWKMPGSCLVGVANNAWDVVKGAYDILANGAKILFSQEYRSEVMATVGVVAVEVQKSPADFAMRLASEMAASIQKYAGETFPCLKPTEQVKSICKLASNLIGAGILAKVLTGGPLTAEQLANLAVKAKDAVGIKGVSKVEKLLPTKSEKAVTEEADKPQLRFDELYEKAPAAKQEIDDLADQLATKYGGSVAKVPLKDKSRASEKLNGEYEGDVGKLKDIARNTIVVSQDKIQSAADDIKLKYPTAEIKDITPDSNQRGWSMVRAIVITKEKMPAEIQINSPEMIYAGFKESQARSILGSAAYDRLSKKIGMQGGLSHILYEKVRKLPDGDEQKAVVEDLCQRYHEIIRQGALGKTQSQLQILIREFDHRLGIYKRAHPGDL